MAQPQRLNNSGLPLYHLTRVGPPASLPQVPDVMDLYRVTTVIGRNATQADFVLDSTNRIRSGYISRLHARIIREGEIHRLRDDSLNGVFINHIKIGGGCILQEGDLVTFGHPNGSNILVGTFKRQSDSEYQFLFTRCDCELQIDPPVHQDTKNKFKTPAVDTKHGDSPDRGGQGGMSSTTNSPTPILPQPDSAKTDNTVKSNTSIHAEKVEDKSESSKKKSTDRSPGKSPDVSKSKPSNMKSATAVIHPYQSSSKSDQIFENDTVEKCSAKHTPGGVDDSKYVVKDSLDTSQESDLNREYLESDSVDYQAETVDVDSRNDTGRNAGTDTEVSVPPSSGSRTDDEGQSDACLTDEAPLEVIVISSESESEEMDLGSETHSREHTKCFEICGDSESLDSVIGHAFKHEPCEPSPVFKKPKLVPEDSKGSDNDKTSPVFSTVVCKTKAPKSQHHNSKSSTKPRKKTTKSWCFSAPIAVASPTYKLSDSSQESSLSSEDESVPSLDLDDSEPVESTPGSADDGTQELQDKPITESTSDPPSEDNSVMKIHHSEGSLFVGGDENSSTHGSQEKQVTLLSPNTASGVFENKASVTEVQDFQSPHLNSNQSNIFTPDLFKSSESANIDSADIGLGHSDKACATSQLSNSQQSESITEYEEDAEQHVSTEFIQQVIHHAKQGLGKMDEETKSEPLQKDLSNSTKESRMLPEDDVIFEVTDLTEGVRDDMYGQAVEKTDVSEQDEDVIEQATDEQGSIDCVKEQLTDQYLSCENVDQMESVYDVRDQATNQQQPDEDPMDQELDQQESVEVMEVNQQQPDEVAAKHVSDQQESVEVLEVNQQQQDEVAVTHKTDQQESVEVLEVNQQQPNEVAVTHILDQQESVEVLEVNQQQPDEVAVKHVSDQQESVEVLEVNQQQPDEVAVTHVLLQQESVEEIIVLDEQGVDEDVMEQAIDQQEPFKDTIDYVKEQAVDDKDTVQVVMTQLLDQLELVEDKDAVVERGPVEVIAEHESEQEKFNEEAIEQVIDQQQQAEDDMTHEGNLEGEVDDVMLQESFQAVTGQVMDEEEPSRQITEQSADQQESLEDVLKKSLVEQGPADVIEEDPSVNQETIQDVTEYETDQQEAVKDVMEHGPVEAIAEHGSEHEEFNEEAMEQVIHQQQQAEDDMTQERNLEGAVDDVKVQESVQAVTRQVMDEQEPSIKITEQATDKLESNEDVTMKRPVDVIEERDSDKQVLIQDVTELIIDIQKPVEEVKVLDQHESVAGDMKQDYRIENITEQGSDQLKSVGDAQTQNLYQREVVQDVTEHVIGQQRPIETVMEQAPFQHEACEDVTDSDQLEVFEDFTEQVTDNHGQVEDLSEQDLDDQEHVQDVMKPEADQQESVEDISERETGPQEPINEVLVQESDRKEPVEDCKRRVEYHQGTVANGIEKCTGTAGNFHFWNVSEGPVQENSHSFEQIVTGDVLNRTEQDKKMENDGNNNEETTKLVTFEAPVLPSDSELKLITSIDECIAETMPLCPHGKEPIAGRSEASERTGAISQEYDSELLAAYQVKKHPKDGDDVNCDLSFINEENASVSSNMPSETNLTVDESQGFCLGASPLIPLSQEEEDMLLADDSMEVPSCSSSESAVSGHITLNLVSNLLKDLVEEVLLRVENDLKDEVTVDPCKTDLGQDLPGNVANVESISVHQPSDSEARPCCSVDPNQNQATNNPHTSDSLKVNVPLESEEDELSPIIPQQAEAVLEHQDSSVVVDSSVLEQEDGLGLTPNLHLHLSQADPGETEDISVVEEEVSVLEENHDVESTQDLHLYLSQVGTEDFSGSDDDPEADVRFNEETSNDLLKESALTCKFPAEANCQALEDRCEESMATSQTTYPSFDLSQDVDEPDREQNPLAPETPSEVTFEMVDAEVEQTESVNVLLGEGPTSEDNTETNLKLSDEEIDNFKIMEDNPEDIDKFGEPHDFDHTAGKVDSDNVEQNQTDCFNEKSHGCDTNATLSTSSEDFANVNDTADNICNSSVQKITQLETTTTEEQLLDEELDSSFKDPKAFEQPSIPFAKNIVASTPKKSSEGNSDSVSTLDSLMVQNDVSSYQKDLSQTKSERTDYFNSEQAVSGTTINSAQSDKDGGNPKDKNPSTSDDDLTSDENCINLQLSGIESQASDFENHYETHESPEEKESENSGKKLEGGILGDMRDKEQTVFKAPQCETDSRDKANVSDQEGDLLVSITAIKPEDKLNESEISFSDEELHLEISASDESHVKSEEPMSTSSDSESVAFVSPIIKFKGTARDIKVASKPRVCVDDSLNTSSESVVSLISPVIKFIGDSAEKSNPHDSSVSLLHSCEKGASGSDTSTSQVNLMRIASNDDVEDPTQDSFDFMRSPSDQDTCSQESVDSESELNISGVAPFDLSDTEQDSVIEVKVDKLGSNIVDASIKDIETVPDSATSESGEPHNAQTKTPERDISTKATTDGTQESIPEVVSTTEKEFGENTDDQMMISVDEPPQMLSPAAVSSDHEGAVKLYLSPTDREPVFTAQPLFKVDDNNFIIFDSEIRQDPIGVNKTSEIGDASQSENGPSTTIRLYSCPDKPSPVFLVKPMICESTSLSVSDQTLKLNVNQSIPESTKNSLEHQSSASKETCEDELKNSQEKESFETKKRETENCQEDTEDCPTDRVSYECDEEQKSQLMKKSGEAEEVEERVSESCDKEGQMIENLKTPDDTEGFVDANDQKSESVDKEQKSQLMKESSQAEEVEERETESCDKEGQMIENLKTSDDTEGFVDADVQKSESVEREQKSQLMKESRQAEEVEERETESCDKGGQTEGFVDADVQKSESVDSEQKSQLMKESRQAEEVEERETENCDKEGQTEGFVDADVQKSEFVDSEQKSQLMKESSQAEEVEERESESCDKEGQTEGFVDADVQKSESVDSEQKSLACDKETSETENYDVKIKESKKFPKKESNDRNLVEDITEKQIEIHDKSKGEALGEEESRINAAVEEMEEKEENGQELTHEEQYQESELYGENQPQESVHLREVTVVQENESHYLQTLTSKKTNVGDTTYSTGQDIPEDDDKENESPARKKRRTSDDERKFLQRMNMVNYVDSFPESEDIEIIDLTEETAPASSVSGTNLLIEKVEQCLKDEPDGLSSHPQLGLEVESEKDVTSRKSSSDTAFESSIISEGVLKRADPVETRADNDIEPLRDEACGPPEGDSSVSSVGKAVTRKRKATDEASGQEKRFCERDILMRDTTFMKKLVAHFFSIRDRVKRRNCVAENCHIKGASHYNMVTDVGIKTEISNELATPSVCYENLEGQIRVELKTEIGIKSTGMKEESTSDIIEQVISPKKEEACSGEKMTNTKDMKCSRETLNDNDIIIISESDSDGVSSENVRQDQEEIRLTCDEISLGSSENPETHGASLEPNKQLASGDNHDNLPDSDEHQDEEMVSDEHHEKEDKDTNEEMTYTLQHSDKDANDMKSDETEANSPQSTSPEPSAEQTSEAEDDSTALLDPAEVSDEEATPSDPYKSVQSPDSSLNLALLSSDDYEVYTDENTPEFYSPAKGSSLKEVSTGSLNLKSEQSSSKVQSKISGNDSSSSQTDRSNVSVHTLDSDYDSDVYITEYSPPSKPMVKTEYITSDDEDDMDSNSRSRSRQFSLKGNSSSRMTNPHQGTSSKFQTTPGKDDERSDKKAGDAVAERCEETAMKEIDEDIEQDDMNTDFSTPLEKSLEEKDQPVQTLTADDLMDQEDKFGAAETARSEESARVNQNEASNMAQTKPSGSNKDTFGRSSSADSLIADFSEDTDSVCGPEVNVGDLIGMLEEDDSSSNLPRSGSLEDIFKGNSKGKTDDIPLEKTDSLKGKQIKASAEAIVEKELPGKKTKEAKDSSFGAVICCSLGSMSPGDRADSALCSQTAVEDPHEKVQNADESTACSDEDELETGSEVYPDVSHVYAGAPSEEDMAVMGSSVESGDTKEDFPQLSGRRKRPRRSSDSGSEVDDKRQCVEVTNFTGVDTEEDDNSAMSDFLGVNDVDTNMDIYDESSQLDVVSDIRAFESVEKKQRQTVKEASSNDQIRNIESGSESEDEANPPNPDDDSDSNMSMPVLEKEVNPVISSNKGYKKSTDIITGQQKPNRRKKPNSSGLKSPRVIIDNSPQMKDLVSEDPSCVHVQPSTSKADFPADTQTIPLAMNDLNNTQISQLDRELAATDNPESKKLRSALDRIRARRKGSSTFQKAEVPVSVPVPVPVTPGELPGPSSIQRNIFQSESQQKVKKMKDCVARCLNVTRLLQQAFKQNEELCKMAAVKDWWDELQDLSSKVQLPRTVIAVVGDTGSGKSSMLNALLHEPRVLPTSGVEACTAVVVEVSENSVNNKYEADIHFLSPEEWEDELKVLLKDLTKMNGELQKRQPDPQTEAGVAFAKVRAVYGKIDTMEALKKQMNITRWLGRVKHVSVATAKELRDKVNTYIESRDTGSKSGQFWPIVKRVELRLPSCDACSSGAILVDLPGVRDANAARDRIAREYLKNCTSVWVVAEIHRAKDNRTAKELLDENFRRQLLMDGQFSSVAFICTKTDSLIPSELKQLLALPSQFDELSDEVSRLGDEIRNLSEEKEEQEVERKTLRSRFKSLQAEYKEMDEEISVARENLLLEEDDEAAADIQEAERELEEKNRDLKETQARIDRIMSHIDTLSKQITQATFKQEQIQRDIAVMCAKARNEHAKSQIKKGFRAGIRELKRRSSNLTEEEDIEDYDDGESDDDDDEEMSSIIHNLQVFCTSSADYQRMTKLLTDGDGGAKVFSRPEETQIPALREFVHSTTLKRREHGVKQMVERVGHFILNIDSYLKMSQLGNKESRQAQPVVNNHLLVLKAKVEEIVANLGEDITDMYSSQIFSQLESGSKVAAMKARPTSDKWGQKVNKTNRDQGGLHFQTYLAVVRRYGRFKSPTAGTIDFNEQLSDPLIKAISLNWGKIFGVQILSCLDKVMKSMNSALEDFSKGIRKDFSKGEVDPLQIDCALRQIFRTATAKLAEMTELMKEYICTQQKEISRLVTPKVKESLAETYVAMTMESGTGSFGRMRKKMADSIDSGCKMFDESASEIRDRLTMLKDSVCVKVRGVLLALCSSFRISFLPLWQSASTFQNIKKLLAQSVAECLVLIQQLYQDVGLKLPVMAEAPPEMDTSLPIEPEETVDEVLGALRHDVEDQVKRLEAVSDEEEVIALPSQKLPATGHKAWAGIKKEPEPDDEFSFSRHIQESGKTILREVSVEGQVCFWNKSVTDAWTPGTLQVVEQNGEWFCNFNSTASPARNKSFKVSRKLIKHLEHTKLQLIIELTNGLGIGCFSQDSQSLQQAIRLLRAIVDGTTDLVSRDEPATVMRSVVTGKRVVVTGVEVSPEKSSTVPGSTSIRDILQPDSNSSGQSASHPSIHPHRSPLTAQRLPESTSIRDNLQHIPDPKATVKKIIVVNTPSVSNTDRTKHFAQPVPTENQDPAASSQCRSKMSTKVKLPEDPKPTYKSLISKQTKDSKSSIASNRCPQYKHKLGRHSVGTFSAVGSEPSKPSSQSSPSDSSGDYKASGKSKTKVNSSVTPKNIPKSEPTSPEKIVQKLLTSSKMSSAKTVTSQSSKMPPSSVGQPSRPESLHSKDIGKKHRVTSRITQPLPKRQVNINSSSLFPGKKVERSSSNYFKLYQPETAKLNPPKTTNEASESLKRTQSAKATASDSVVTSVIQNNPSRISVMDTSRPSLSPLRSCSTQNQTSTKIQTSATSRPADPFPESSQQKGKHGKNLSLKSLKRTAPLVVKQEPLEEVVVQKRSRLEEEEVVVLSDSDDDLEDISSNPSCNTANNSVASIGSDVNPRTGNNRFINHGKCDKSSSKPVASNKEAYQDCSKGQDSMENSDDSSSDDNLPSFLR